MSSSLSAVDLLHLKWLINENRRTQNQDKALALQEPEN